MRFNATIELRHLAHGDPLSEPARAALEASTAEHFHRKNLDVMLPELRISARAEGVFVCHAALMGKRLISPLDALTLLDESVRRALMATGLFEEFDVARRRLEAWAAQ